MTEELCGAIEFWFLTCPELRPIDAQLPHSGAERMGIDAEKIGCPAWAFNPAVRRRQGALDVGGHRLIESDNLVPAYRG